MTTVVISFGLSLFVFVGIGLFATRKKKASSEDYLLASRQMNPWFVALSAAATANSGFMFIGMIGETYRVGLASTWVMAGWLVGDYLAWRSGIPERLRRLSEEKRVSTIPTFLSHGLEDGRGITVLAALAVLVFLGAYAAAQLTAGSKALEVVFGWHYTAGALIGAVIVLGYCFAGGIRASIWTDAAQAIVMLCAMGLLAVVAVMACGGWGTMFGTLEGADPKLVSLAPEHLEFGIVPFVMGWLFAGLGVLGQPHVMVRAMAIDSPQHVGKARRIYITWNLLFATFAIIVGLASRAYLPPASGFDPEFALPTLATELLPSVLVGVMLAGIFAATMSTADSQVLACSAALSQDLMASKAGSYRAVKVGTVVIMLCVLAAAMLRMNVFRLVVVAWASLAAGLGPLLVVRSLGWPVSGRTGVVMMLSGVAAVITWRVAFHYSHDVADVLPGVAAGFSVYALSLVASRSRVVRRALSATASMFS